MGHKTNTHMGFAIPYIVSFILCLAGTALASTVNVDLDEEHQVIRGFGGMVHNTWQGGKGLSEADAKLAFGTGEGQIGLNTLRIPVNENSNDFGREVQAAKYAKAAAGKDFILYATPWKPPTSIQTPYTLIRWGQSYNTTQIVENNWQSYVNHLNSFTNYMKEQGVPLYGISIQNEPDWCDSWTCWTADNLYKFTKNYANQLRKNGTKVISAESFSYDKNLYNKILNDADALKNIDILGAHFYGMTAANGDNFFQYPLADQKNVERWMTEHYTESQGSANYWRKYMLTGDQANPTVEDTVRAMDVAYEIHRGLVVGNFSQYTWWYIRRCYGLIMETDASGKLQIPQKEVGKVSKRGYVLSQFARFVRPGAVRIGATANPEKDVYASAYRSGNGDSVIVVLLNRDYTEKKTVTVKVSGAEISTFQVYTTSEAKNAVYDGEIEVKNGSVTITMDAGNINNKDCIVTLVGVGQQIVTPRIPYQGSAITLPGIVEAEEYDIPGSGNGNKTYIDEDSENKGDADFRMSEGVDIYEGGSGKAVGFTQVGEWMEYSVNVIKAGEYDLTVNAASGSETSSFQFSIDGNNVTDVIEMPKTGEDWSVYEEINIGKVPLTEGSHTVRLSITGSYVNIDWFRFGTPEEISQYGKKKKNGNRNTDIEGNDTSDEAIDATETFTHFQITTKSEQYRLFDLKGQWLGSVQAANLPELQKKASKFVKQNGTIFTKSPSGKVFRLNVTR